jgi:diadenosine tetraphosphate (Ap4A) HIT family hydrolase
MPTLFTRIIEGEIPGRFVWRDDRAVAFLSINPLRPGHTLVVPIDEVDHWLDCPPDLFDHLTTVAREIGAALQAAYQPVKVGLVLAGLEVPHLHLHVVPIWSEADLDFRNADRDPGHTALEESAETLRAELAGRGHPLS